MEAPILRPAVLSIGILVGHPLLRDCLRYLLQGTSKHRVAWDAAMPADAPAQTPLDLLITDQPAQAFANELKMTSPRLRILVLGSDVEISGAVTIPPETRAKQFLHAVERSTAAPQTTRRSDCGLTPGERRVLNQIARGRSTDEVRQDLNISANTLKTHLRGVYRKLRVRGKTEAVIEAIRIGLVRPFEVVV